MPLPDLAQSTINHWGDGLEKLTQGLKEQASVEIKGKGKDTEKDSTRVLTRWPKSGTYGWQAMKMWRSCLVGVEKDGTREAQEAVGVGVKGEEVAVPEESGKEEVLVA